ncbi:MAG: amidase [Saprospiraceae bacterium]|nr:amidase [Saprospiraceae bacterium]
MKRRNFIQHSASTLIGAQLWGLYACNTPESSPPPTDSTFSFEEMTIDQMQAGFSAGDFSIESVAKAYLDRIEQLDQAGPKVNSIIEVNPEAIDIAKQLDEELKAGNARGPLHGIPIVLKDNIDTNDKMLTTAGSRALLGSRPLQDSWVAAKLREAGALILGKANLSEWANFRSNVSSSGWSGRGGQTKNPYVTDRNPCGSSAGSGAAVSANFCMLAIGTETNGSIVCPSHANGVVGIKPTVGLVSRAGIIPISETQDTAGPMARTVKDAAICLGALTGIDPKDDKTAASAGKSHTDYTTFLKKDGLQGKKIGLYTRALGFHHQVDELIEKAVTLMEAQGAEVIRIDRIGSGDGGRDSFQIMLYEFKDGLNKYFASLGPDAPIKNLEDLIAFNKQDSIESSFDQGLLEMAQKKESLDTPEYKELLDKMLKNTREKGIDEALATQELDAIIAPTGSAAWKIDPINGDLFLGGSSSPAARAGYPNITVPMGWIEGLPVGISFFSGAWMEPLLIEMAYAYEQASMHRKAPTFKES